MSTWRWRLLLACTVAAPVFAGASDSAALRLSLKDAEQLWREHNREVKLARSAVTGAEADVTVAGQAPNPQLSVNFASISPSEGYGAGPLKDKKMDTIIRLEQLIERGDKRELREQTASARLEATQHDLSDAVRQQRIVLWSAYYDLLLAQEKKRTAEESAALYAKSLRATETRLKVGDIAQNDLSRLRVEKLRAENDARQAVVDFDKAQNALAYLIGKESQARLLEASDAWPEMDTPVGDVADLSAVANRPDVKAAQARVVAAEVARDLARSLKTRDVTVGVQLEHNLQNLPTNSFGFGVSVPLFVRYEYDGEVARALSDLQQARDQMDRVVALAIGELEQARSQLAGATERRQRVENELIADADRVAKGAEFAYTRGAMGLMDLLDARRTWRQVQLEAAQTRADYAKARAAWRMLIAGEQP